VQNTFASLHTRNYRLWFIGQLVSLAGTWMQTTAQGYLVFELTKSPAFLGYVGFAAGLPTWVFTLYAGVVADRLPRRSILLVAQSAMMVGAFALAWLVFKGTVQPWHIVVIALAVGVANAFDAPARQAFVADLVDRRDLTNAIALNATMFNTAAVVGPALAGVVYAAFGPVWCFTLNGLSYIAVIVALLLMKLNQAAPKQQRASAGSQIKEGLRYTASQGLIRTLILNMGVISLFAMSLMTLLPAWSVDVLGGDVRTNGLLISARGLGALTGALMVAALGRRPVRGKLWTAGSFVLPAAMMAFTVVRWIPLSFALLVLVGWGFMSVANTSNALVQTSVPDELRGRVMGLYTLVFFGGMTLGALLIGTVAERIGEPTTVFINAAVVLAVAAVIWWRLPFIRKSA
jgi:MFS family permease